MFGGGGGGGTFGPMGGGGGIIPCGLRGLLNGLLRDCFLLGLDSERC